LFVIDYSLLMQAAAIAWLKFKFPTALLPKECIPFSQNTWQFLQKYLAIANHGYSRHMNTTQILGKALAEG
jgi:hypothetical protein